MQLSREAFARYRTGAVSFRKVGPRTYERFLQFDANPEDLINHSNRAVHEIIDIARSFGLIDDKDRKIWITRSVAEI